MLREFINGEYDAAQYESPALQGGGGWAKVITVSGGNVEVTIESFDGATYRHGPIPYRTWSVDPPEPGDRVWLLVDSAGQPGLALV